MQQRQRKVGRIHPTEAYLVSLKATSSCAGFFDEACYQFYLRRLLHSLNFFQIKLHAYLLLPDSILLLLTPCCVTGIERLVVALNNAYRAYFNTRFSRTAKLWNSRPNLISITNDELVLACQKYIEREPVQSGIVSHAGAWRWSSYCTNAFGGNERFITRHRAFTELFLQESDPAGRYRAYIALPFGDARYYYLRNRIERNLALPGPGQRISARKSGKIRGMADFS